VHATWLLGAVALLRWQWWPVGRAALVAAGYCLCYGRCRDPCDFGCYGAVPGLACSSSLSIVVAVLCCLACRCRSSSLSRFVRYRYCRCCLFVVARSMTSVGSRCRGSFATAIAVAVAVACSLLLAIVSCVACNGRRCRHEDRSQV
jgi:hypothetical protein